MSSKWTAETVVSAIKELNQEGVALDTTSINRTHRNLVWAAGKYLGGWRKAVEAAGIEYVSVCRINPNRQTWSEDVIIEAIRVLHQKGSQLNSNYIQTLHKPLYGAACKYFGGWSQAIQASGLDYKQILRVEHRLWSRETILDAIVARSEAKMSIRGSTVSLEDRGLYQATRRHFGYGGWAKARVLAGFTPIDPLPHLIWTREAVLAEIHRFTEDGIELHTQGLNNAGCAYLHSAGRKVFGTWAKAINAAGLDYDAIRKKRTPWKKNEILLGIKQLEKQGFRLSSKATRHSHASLFAAAVSWFGSWSQAVEAAGISYRKHCRTWSTKAWLRRMDSDEYNLTLETSRAFARKRRLS